MKHMSLRPVKKVLEEENLSRGRLYQLLKDGHIKARKVGYRTFIVDESVERWKRSLPAYVPMSQRTAPQSTENVSDALAE